MNEKIISTKRNGMAMMLLLIAALILSGTAMVICFSKELYLPGVLLLLALIVSSVCLNGLKVLKPQEALVLTLFGEYLGTIKGEGFYFVNPLAVAVNPASHTVLNQSGDVKSGLEIGRAHV